MSLESDDMIRLRLNSEDDLCILIENDTEKMWVDCGALPDSAFLCACHDGCKTLRSKTESGASHMFLEMDWVINEWGGYPDLVKAIKDQRDRIIKELPNIRERLNASDNFDMEI